ncbi:hypothetical protein SDRG_03604 [Saprolegnia diclina VS20]|uniref:Uncharacterized protein n=1 Tax=Saprolegnia diclina (strain VS20) TaxID=1156394 RepID=T0S9J4_SAPDV|nr:hypothetical protein SDRG_03604 [Saprolegnia diclina VS20]EQC39402.1 hypothetical protein SDRG_03604 [Saprolegnia diclina VS20]|eukprot:XP_008607463.1 hypothetical protein SDRG_03604 [Saprolegnia diclina VS20]
MKLSRVAVVGLLFVAARTVQVNAQESSDNNLSTGSEGAASTSYTPSTDDTKSSSTGPAPIVDVIQAAVEAGATPQQAAVIAVAADTGASFSAIIETAIATGVDPSIAAAVASAANSAAGSGADAVTSAPITDVIEAAQDAGASPAQAAAVADAASSGVTGSDLVAVALAAGVNPSDAVSVASAASSAAGAPAPIAEIIQAALDNGASLGQAAAIAVVVNSGGSPDDVQAAIIEAGAPASVASSIASAVASAIASASGSESGSLFVYDSPIEDLEEPMIAPMVGGWGSIDHLWWDNQDVVQSATDAGATESQIRSILYDVTNTSTNDEITSAVIAAVYVAPI